MPKYTGFACRSRYDRFDNQSRLMKIRIGFDEIDPWNDQVTDKLYGETEKAIGFTINGQKIWMPKSQIEDMDYGKGELTQKEDCYLFYIPYWLMKEKAFETFVDTSDEPGLFDDQE